MHVLNTPKTSVIQTEWKPVNTEDIYFSLLFPLCSHRNVKSDQIDLRNKLTVLCSERFCYYAEAVLLRLPKIQNCSTDLDFADSAAKLIHDNIKISKILMLFLTLLEFSITDSTWFVNCVICWPLKEDCVWQGGLDAPIVMNCSLCAEIILQPHIVHQSKSSP